MNLNLAIKLDDAKSEINQIKHELRQQTREQKKKRLQLDNKINFKKKFDNSNNYKG